MDTWQVFIGVSAAAAFTAFFALRVIIYRMNEQNGSWERGSWNRYLAWVFLCIPPVGVRPAATASTQLVEGLGMRTWQPLPDALIASLPAFQFLPVIDKDGTEGEMQQCPICQDDYEHQPDVPLATLPCKHTFHLHCLQAWLSRKASCPMCQLELSTALMAEHNAGNSANNIPAGATSMNESTDTLNESTDTCSPRQNGAGSNSLHNKVAGDDCR